MYGKTGVDFIHSYGTYYWLCYHTTGIHALATKVRSGSALVRPEPAGRLTVVSLKLRQPSPFYLGRPVGGCHDFWAYMAMLMTILGLITLGPIELGIIFIV